MTNEFLIYFDLTCESYITQDKYFEKYRELMMDSLDTMDMENLTGALNSL